MIIRKAGVDDIDNVAKIYDATHSAEEAGKLRTGWIRGIYPTRESAESAQSAGCLFVLDDNGSLKGAAILNKVQHPAYNEGNWLHAARPDEIMVLHTLVIDPACSSQGLGKKFLCYYVDYALAQGCTWLRLDTNAINQRARDFYRKAGFWEAGVVKTTFNGLNEVNLVLLEGNAQDMKERFCARQQNCL